MSRRTWLVAVVVLAVAGAGTGVALYASRARAGEPAPPPAALPTVPVTRGDLATSVQQPGQLGYLGSHQLIGHRPGTVTAVPRTGQVVERGQPVCGVDQRPIPLLYGELPLYRPLGVGATGEDVRQLEQNLVELGHGPGLTVDNRYTAATETAVKRWQRALGVPQTGTVEAGDAVLAPGPVRITEVRSTVGTPSAPGQAIATATGTGHGVQVDLDRRYQALAVVDRPVRIQLFGGRAVDGVVAAVGATAAPTQDTQPGNGNSGNSGNAGNNNNQRQTIDVDIRITSPVEALGGVFEGPVTVVFFGETRRGVLSVPVEALTLGPGGDYAVVVVDAAGRRTVDVRTGLITSNRVEVSGQGIAEGVRVEVPSL